MPLLISLVTFVVVLAVIFGAWLALTGDAKEGVIRQRLDAIRLAEKRGGDTQELRIIRDEMLSSIPTLNRVMLQWSWVGDLRKATQQAGLSTRPARILLLSAVLGLGSYLLIVRTVGSELLAVFAWALLTLLPFGVIAVLRRRRLRKFEERFPDALDLLGRAVRAGHAFTTGLEMIANESPDPIAGEFRQTFEEQNLGLPLRDTLLNLTERVPLVDVRLFVTALLLQKDTGGNLAEILDELARIIRERFRIYREVKVKTAQGRLTAGILIVLFPIMIVALDSANPTYIGLLLHDPVGQTMLLVAAGMQLVGSLLLWKIVHVDV
jgi:tight adherence protein B